jgi:hypothetical protein
VDGTARSLTGVTISLVPEGKAGVERNGVGFVELIMRIFERKEILLMRGLVNIMLERRLHQGKGAFFSVGWGVPGRRIRLQVTLSIVSGGRVIHIHRFIHPLDPFLLA